MQTDEFVPITEATILSILSERHGAADGPFAGNRRAHNRRTFPGTVELWVGRPNGEDDYLLARALNLSPAGVGILLDEALDAGAEVNVAIHQPEVTLFGKAVVRHSRLTEYGTHAGLEFVY